jgi:hypothetical protein
VTVKPAWALLVAVALGGCADRNLTYDADGGAGDGGGGACASLSTANCHSDPRCTLVPGCCGVQRCIAVGTSAPQCGISCPLDCTKLNEASCKGVATCVADYCYECSCTPTFVGCRAVSATPTPCPGLGCQPACGCTGLSESACKAAAPSLGCTADYCPDCHGGQTYAGCSGPNEGAPFCANNCPAILDGGVDAGSCSSSCVGGGPGCNKCAPACANGQICCAWAGGPCMLTDAGTCAGAGGYKCATPTSQGLCPNQCYP